VPFSRGREEHRGEGMPLRLDIKKKLSCRSDRVKSVDFHTTEPWVLAGLYSGNLFIYDYNTQALIKQVEVGMLPVRNAKFVVRKQWIVAACDDMFVHIYNYNTLEKIKAVEAHTDYIRFICIHPTSPYLLSCSDDMSVKLWDWDKAWANTTTFEGHAHYVMMAQFNPKDTHIFATASLDRTIKVWGVQGSTSSHFTLSGHERGVNCIEYSPSGEKPYLVSGSDDKTVRVWDYQTKQCVQVLSGHTGNVTTAVFHPNLPVILTGSEDGTCRVWHSATYRLESTLTYLLERLWSISCVKGSNHAALGFDEGTIVLKLGSDEPVASMHGGKVVWSRGNDIQTANLKIAEEAAEGEKVQVAVKDMGSCDLFPQTIAHHPNGRLFAVCGDGEYVIYTAQALRNKSFGHALEFVWSHDGNYATREASGKIAIFQDFKEAVSFKPAFQPEELFGGRLLGVKGSTGSGGDAFVCFHDWSNGRMIRRIDVSPTMIFWSESGNCCAIVAGDATYILSHNKDCLDMEANDEDGIESSFEVASQVSDKVVSGCWVSECFVFVSGAQRLQYVVSGQVETLAHLDKQLYLLGYLPEQGKIYMMDKEINLIPYNLNMALLEYESAMVRKDYATAEQHFAGIPSELHTRVARFLEHQGLLAEALAITKDPEHKFELALQLGKLHMAADIIRTNPDSQAMTAKWKPLGDVALEQGEFDLAKACFETSKDLSGLFLLQTSTGDAEGLRATAKMAEAAGKMNTAVTCYFLLQDTDALINCLISSGRLPEAGFFARVYCPEHIPRVLKLWKDDLKNVNEQVASSLADPTAHPHLFPELAGTTQAAQVFAAQRAKTLGAAAGYSQAKDLVGLNVQDALAAKGPAGLAAHLGQLLGDGAPRPAAPAPAAPTPAVPAPLPVAAGGEPVDEDLV